MVHPGRPPEPHDLWSAWTLEPGQLLLLGLIGLAYGVGVRRLWRRAGVGAGGVGRREAALFALGLAALALALVSPLHAMGSALLTAHMAQHEVLMVVAAPLLVLGRPAVPLAWAVPSTWTRTAGRLGRVPPVARLRRVATGLTAATVLHGAAIWLWHAPPLYEAAVRSEATHAAQHAAFLGSALLFWWALLARRHRAAEGGIAVFYLFLTTLHTGALGAVLTLASRPWYGAYTGSTAAWGLTPLEDQQLAGLVMWVPGGLAYVVAALWLFAAWLREGDRRAASAGARAVTVPALVALAACAGTLAACHGDERPARVASALTGGDPERGRAAVVRYGCGSCHTIPGVAGANSLVGPPLAGLVERAYVAGVLTNTPDHLVRWIQGPRSVDPLTAMPDLGVGAGEARDIAAYLYTLR